MKKRIVAAAMSTALALGMFAGCSSSTSSTAQSTAAGSTSSTAASTAAAGDGKVFYLNFKPEQDAQWQELAELYTAETGVPVTVKTAASGQYETTLKADMAKSEAPTLF